MEDQMRETSSSSPVIRTMLPEDLGRIVEIDLRILEKSRTEYWETKLELIEKQSQISSLVAELDKRVVGFIIGGASKWEYGVPEHIGWIDTIGVDPDCQGKGIARMLFSELTDRLKKVGVDSITTFVNRRDPILLKFFKCLGFQKGDMINLELDI